MNFRLLLCIAMGLFTTALGIVMLTASLRPAPAERVRAKPNFSAQQARVTDPNTGEKLIVREITVTTKLAPTPATQPPETPQ